MANTSGFKVVIPARYASTRLPAKPLLDLGGKPMVARVAERAAQSGAEEIWVATDHPDVEAAARARRGERPLETGIGRRERRRDGERARDGRAAAAAPAVSG